MQRRSEVSGPDAKRTAPRPVHLSNGIHDKNSLVKELGASNERRSQLRCGGEGAFPSRPFPEEGTMEHKEANEMLSNIGFTASEIERLQRLRSEYAEKKMSHMSPEDHRRLEFVRWLVTTGKLTDQIA
jgi:hypothetical protein